MDKKVLEAALREQLRVKVVNHFSCRRAMGVYTWELLVTDLDCTVKQKGTGRAAKIRIKVRARFQVTGQEPGRVEVLRGVATFRGRGSSW